MSTALRPNPDNAVVASGSESTELQTIYDRLVRGEITPEQASERVEEIISAAHAPSFLHRLFRGIFPSLSRRS